MTQDHPAGSTASTSVPERVHHLQDRRLRQHRPRQQELHSLSQRLSVPADSQDLDQQPRQYRLRQQGPQCLRRHQSVLAGRENPLLQLLVDPMIPLSWTVATVPEGNDAVKLRREPVSSVSQCDPTDAEAIEVLPPRAKRKCDEPQRKRAKSTQVSGTKIPSLS